MDTENTTLIIPTRLYERLHALANAEQLAVPELLAQMTEQTERQTDHTHQWQATLRALRALIQQEGSLSVGADDDELLDRLRHTRRDLFDAEYADLYR